ncbi:phosphatidylethanolamine-binding protein [Podospora conica]|nr:phosphatidylethanolamine-binding protein [Schizothecium conicum]
MSSRSQRVARPILRSLQQQRSPATCPSQPLALAIRQFSSTTARKNEGTTIEQPPTSTSPDVPRPPMKGSEWTPEQLERLMSPIMGSRRRRAALATSDNVPFEQMPYECFQEARQILNEDRNEKIAAIVAETEKIKRLEAMDPSTYRGGEKYKQKRLDSLRRHVAELKILADINDPLVKRRFEDGMGDMSKPIYRYLAERKWRKMDYKILVQRLTQFNIVPDLLAKFDPVMDIKMSFRGRATPPGTTLEATVTEVAPTLTLQVFDAGERLITVVVVDADVPDVEHDWFSRRCHFMAVNIPWDPTKKQLPLRHFGTANDRSGGTLAVPWLPPFAQKGAPYHRLSIFILEQKPGERLDEAAVKERYNGPGRDNFSLKGLRDKFALKPVGFTLFRTEWDASTAAVMARHGIPGADVEFKFQHMKSLKGPRKARGWEAKRQKPKYKSLWKYTKRIA